MSCRHHQETPPGVWVSVYQFNPINVDHDSGQVGQQILALPEALGFRLLAGRFYRWWAVGRVIDMIRIVEFSSSHSHGREGILVM